jgi:hypothetical protein
MTDSLTARRYHCHRCHRSVCDADSLGRGRVEHYPEKSVRRGAWTRVTLGSFWRDAGHPQTSVRQYCILQST